MQLRPLSVSFVLGLAAACAAVPAAAATYDVKDNKTLKTALGKVVGGDIINLAPGTYAGITLTRSGQAGKPILMQGPVTAVFKKAGGYGISLKAKYWNLVGFSVTASAKGIVLDGASHNVMDGLEVHDIDEEAIHLRAFSSFNVIQNGKIYNTGRGTLGYGEGIYVGSAATLWSKFSGGKPDRSDSNCIASNVIGPGVTAEGIDIKEGTANGIVVDNQYDAKDISGDHFADSFIDAKGNQYVIYGNRVVNGNAPNGKDGRGATITNNYFLNAFETHVNAAGWGNNNKFVANTVDMKASGYDARLVASTIETTRPGSYGFRIASESNGNVVCDSNQVGNAAAGAANVPLLACTIAKPVCPAVLSF